MSDDLNQLIKPAGATSSGDEPVIHVIPEKFYGAALRKQVPPTPSVPPASSAAPVPPTPPKPTVPAAARKKGSKLPFVIIGLLVLALAGLAAYYFLVLAKPQPAANQNANAPVNVPAGPVCGNARCESGESTATCAADCPAPAPVCGDAKCDAGESTASCAVDCPAPAPVCGDNKCEGAETVASCADDCTPPPPTVGTDADSDGISDEEETKVYGTNPNDPNTDKDSYVDLNELLNLFDPATPSPAMLRDNPGIEVHANATQSYEVFHPAAWSVNGEGESVSFAAQTGERVQVLVVAKGAAASLRDWYVAQSPDAAGQTVSYRTRQGYDALISPDQSVHYVDLGDRVAVVTYVVGQRNQLHYKVTFQMMVQSLRKTN